ncbi:unnamed protein product [Coregonus sp. 'balchen']|nr:unnamed protein product [Coregonus sp. 'balchen']
MFGTVEVTMEFGLDKRHQTLTGLAFPLQEEAKRSLQQLKQKRINYIQLVSWHHITNIQNKAFPFAWYSCSIKERMLYSSCKNQLLDEVERDCCLAITKKMEIDGEDGLMKEFLNEEVHPVEHTLKQAFAKPRGPGGKRGNKRLIKGAGEYREEN